MVRSIYLVLAIVLTASIGQAQTLNFPDHPKLPEKFKNAIQKQTEEFDRLFDRDSAISKHYSTAFMLDKIDNDSNHRYLFLAEYWIAFHYSEIIPALIGRVTNKKEIGLINYADLIIWERIESKQMNFYGHGGISNDDLFTIAGRANRLLTNITGENFGYVSMHSTQEELEELQKKWITWLIALK